MQTRVVAALVFGALAAPSGTVAQVLSGRVLYTVQDSPVEFGVVELIDRDGERVASTTTSANGTFRLTIPSNADYAVRVHHVAAHEITDGPIPLRVDRETFVVFHVEARPFALESLGVVVDRRTVDLLGTGFYERRAQTSGVFVDREAIERRNPLRTTDLLRSLPGVRILEGRTAGEGNYVMMSYALRTRLRRGPCFPRVYLDGIVAEVGGNTPPGWEFDRLVHAQDLAGMEVYRSPAEVPPQYGGVSAACGVIVMWTRRGSGDTW